MAFSQRIAKLILGTARERAAQPGGGSVLRTAGQGSIGAQLGDYTLQLPSLGGLTDDERANVFDSLPEAAKAILSRANAVNLAGVYHTLYRYIGPAGTQPLDRASVDFSDTSLWQRFEPQFSNDAAFKLGATLPANSAVQFLFADRFGLRLGRRHQPVAGQCGRRARQWRAGGGHRQRLPGPGVEVRQRALHGARRRQPAGPGQRHAGGRYARPALPDAEAHAFAGGAGRQRRGVRI
ncbi:hypothetical protein G6F40_013727 [Rhizopus arrhizus]|nr:hypothetical protein G6F40_013727 [Rhizopus arrhizus]